MTLRPLAKAARLPASCWPLRAQHSSQFMVIIGRWLENKPGRDVLAAGCVTPPVGGAEPAARPATERRWAAAAPLACKRAALLGGASGLPGSTAAAATTTTTGGDKYGRPASSADERWPSCLSLAPAKQPPPAQRNLFVFGRQPVGRPSRNYRQAAGAEGRERARNPIGAAGRATGARGQRAAVICIERMRPLCVPHGRPC